MKEDLIDSSWLVKTVSSSLLSCFNKFMFIVYNGVNGNKMFF